MLQKKEPREPKSAGFFGAFQMKRTRITTANDVICSIDFVFFFRPDPSGTHAPGLWCFDDQKQPEPEEAHQSP